MSLPDRKLEAEFGAAVLVAGIDEAGRGCLAGPVVAAAVILPPDFGVDGVQDSKKLSAQRREALAPKIRDQALAWAVAACSPPEIDRLNILHAAMEAMRRAAAALNPAPDALLIDGNRAFPMPGLPTRTVVSGDSRSLSIAAASILAKTERDATMRRLDALHPEYGWARNKGYPTAEHYDALAIHGPTTHHRRSFALRRRNAAQTVLFPDS